MGRRRGKEGKQEEGGIYELRAKREIFGRKGRKEKDIGEKEGKGRKKEK